MGLMRRLRSGPSTLSDGQCTVVELSDAAADIRNERERREEAERAAEKARREREGALAREKQFDELARDQEAAWTRVHAMIDTKRQSEYDAAVKLLKDLQAVPSAPTKLRTSRSGSLTYANSVTGSPPSSIG
ncbi:hypothetical protein ABZ801_10900 [Actinomadura sp. NPDC047616]|uniref:hypothetical protein n=1 Tax=Actinomadura sp. NPDC047616 TaxID=3155914 RepID=UPI0033CA61AB